MTGTAWNVEKMSFFGEKKFQLKFYFLKKLNKFFNFFYEYGLLVARAFGLWWHWNDVMM